MLAVFVHLQNALARLAPERGDPLPPRLRGARGQTTAEYALVVIGATAIAALVVTWASKTDLISKLFDFVVGHVVGLLK
jgi:hypothetical protein